VTSLAIAGGGRHLVFVDRERERARRVKKKPGSTGKGPDPVATWGEDINQRGQQKAA